MDKFCYVNILDIYLALFFLQKMFFYISMQLVLFFGWIIELYDSKIVELPCGPSININIWNKISAWVAIKLDILLGTSSKTYNAPDSVEFNIEGI